VISSSHSSPPSSQTIRSLDNGLRLLRQFTPEHPERGITEVAREMGLSPSALHRYSAACLNDGYLEQAQTRLYRPGRRCVELGLAVAEVLEPRRAAGPIVRELRAESGRTVSLAVLDGTEVLYVQRLCGFQEGQFLLEGGLGAGSRLGTGETAAGLALAEMLTESRGRKTPWSTGNELVVSEGAPRAGARGLAVAVSAGGQPRGAIEITVPAAAMDGAQLSVEHGEQLRRAGEKWRMALIGEDGETCIAGSTS
jgi:DNA-binding IclR family transcriptional regulator